MIAHGKTIFQFAQATFALMLMVSSILIGVKYNNGPTKTVRNTHKTPGMKKNDIPETENYIPENCITPKFEEVTSFVSI